VVYQGSSQTQEAATIETVRAIKESRFFDALLIVAASAEAQGAAQKISELCEVTPCPPDALVSCDAVALVHGGAEASMQDLQCLAWHHLEQGTDYTAPIEFSGPADKAPALFSSAGFKRLSDFRNANPSSASPTEQTLRRLGLTMSFYRASHDPFHPTTPSEKIFRSGLERASVRGIRGTLRWLAQLARRKP
jgi:hypothetical protein